MVYESDSAVKLSCIRMVHGVLSACFRRERGLQTGCEQQIPHAPQSGGSE
jgi:hypothetical protein